MVFVEMPPFRRRLAEFLDDEDFRTLQSALIAFPDAGDVMQGCGGLRKLRWARKRQGQGRRGGCRIIYLFHKEFDRIDLLVIYGKDEQDDLTVNQKRHLSALARAARASVRQSGRDRK